MELIGSAFIVISSIMIGFILSDNLTIRYKNIKALISLVDHIRINIQMFRTPLESIFSSFENDYLKSKSFFNYLNKGIYFASEEAGIITCSEEKEIIKDFSDKIGTGNAEEMEKLCEYTLFKLREIEKEIHNDYPHKQRIYRIISFLAGLSLIIIII